MAFRYQVRRVFLAPALGLTLAAALAACSSPASSAAAGAPASSAPATSAVAQITANWVKFFSASTPDSERVALLQNGQIFTSAIASFASSPLASQVTSTVKSVALTSATQATVKYDITAAGIAVASGQTGTSVLQNGVWKVGDDIFCGLLKEGASLLNITLPAACK